jgi:hypothetical protein
VLGLFEIAAGIALLARLLPRYQQVLEILASTTGAGARSSMLGVAWSTVAGACVALHVALRRWALVGRLRRWATGALLVVPFLTLMRRIRIGTVIPDAGLFCSSWECVATSYAVWLTFAVAIIAIGIFLVVRSLRRTMSPA